MASELSLFSSTSNAGEGVCAAVKFAASRKTPNAPAAQIDLGPEFIHGLLIIPPTPPKASSKYYTLACSERMRRELGDRGSDSCRNWGSVLFTPASIRAVPPSKSLKSRRAIAL